MAAIEIIKEKPLNPTAAAIRGTNGEITVHRPKR
jgi:hypothetical protein